MYWLRFPVVLICLLLISCRSETSPISSEPTPTPQGPSVISNNPNAVVKTWEYISPHSEKALTSFLSSDSEAIKFGPELDETYIVWREGGFDLVWGGYFCSTEPILTINDAPATIELWLNDAIWDDCVAMEAIHAFKVELETDIPPEKWTYVVHPDAPPP